MSKSKKNVVDPGSIINEYGADTARWYMLSDSPPERDLEWTDAGAAGAWRFTQRLWRLFDGAIGALPDSDEITADLSSAGLALRGETHRMLAGITDDVETFRFNRAVARIYEFTNTVSGFNPEADVDNQALREALTVLVQVVGPMMPHLAEEMWQRLGHTELLADTAWPTVIAELAEEDTITIGVQVAGKMRGTIEIAKDSDQDLVQKTALALPTVQTAIGDKEIRKVIVVPNRIVNVVI
jgi:leucyl-tRNA synthetase